MASSAPPSGSITPVPPPPATHDDPPSKEGTEWFLGHKEEVAEVLRVLLEETDKPNPRVRRIPPDEQTTRKYELEILDPGCLPVAAMARVEFFLSLQSFAVQYQKDKLPSVSPDQTHVHLVMPAKAPIVTCMKVCMTRIPPSFELIVPTACHWHEVRCSLGRWLWKGVEAQLARGLAKKLFNREDLQLEITFNMSRDDQRPVNLTGRRLYDVMWAVMNPACVALSEYCGANHTADDHRMRSSSHVLMDEFFLKFLAQRIIFLVDKICLEKADEAIKAHMIAVEDDDEGPSVKRRRIDDEEDKPEAEGRRSRRIRFERERLHADDLREFLENLRRAEKVRLDSVPLPSMEIPQRILAEESTEGLTLPDLLRWKPPEVSAYQGNSFRLPAELSPSAPKGRISDFDWSVITGVLKFIRDRGVNVLASTVHNAEWNIGEIVTDLDKQESRRLPQRALQRTAPPRKVRRRKLPLEQYGPLLEGDVIVNKVDPSSHVWSLRELKGFFEGQAIEHPDEKNPEPRDLFHDLIGPETVLEVQERGSSVDAGGTQTPPGAAGSLMDENELAVAGSPVEDDEAVAVDASEIVED